MLSRQTDSIGFNYGAAWNLIILSALFICSSAVIFKKLSGYFNADLSLRIGGF